MEDSPAVVSYEDLASIEDEFEEVDAEIMRKQYALSTQIYAKRSQAVRKILNFWPLVVEQAPPEIDQWIQPHDSRIFAESLLNVEVRRPELDDGGAGNPRSISVKFEFKPNDDFEDTELEKTFSYRRARDGWTGLVSEPVKVHWKKGKDLTEGLTDGAVALFEARTKIGDMTATGLPEYTALKKKVDKWNGSNTSFFTWFGWVSQRRWVSAEESEKAVEEYKQGKERRKTRSETKEVEAEIAEAAEDDEEEDEFDDEAVEVHQMGEELAISFAEELWPSAIKFFTQAQEDEISEPDFEDDDDEEDDRDGDEPVDFRALVQDKGDKVRPRESTGGAALPNKKQKKK